MCCFGFSDDANNLVLFKNSYISTIKKYLVIITIILLYVLTKFIPTIK
jgi:hypothetical protein